jgi:hypothetical protein
MNRPRSLSIFAAAAVVASLLACGGSSGTGGSHGPALGPYSLARTSVTPVLRADPVFTPDLQGGASPLRETRRMCDLHGGKGSC